MTTGITRLAAGTRVRDGHGAWGTVLGYRKDSLSVAIDGGGTHSGPAHHRTWEPLTATELAMENLERTHPRLWWENTGGGCMALIAYGDQGTVVVTDDGDAVLVGYYPGQNWMTGEDQGNVLDAIAVDRLHSLPVLVTAQLAVAGPLT